MKIVTSEEMRKIDNETIKKFRISSTALMERAGRAVATKIREMFDQSIGSCGQSVVVVSGTGNNGGDGIVAARNLHEWGWDVRVFICGKQDGLSPECNKQYEKAKKQGLKIEFLRRITGKDLDGSVIVDAMLGTGLSRQVTGDHASVISSINASQATVVAVDIPSGISADTGQIMGEAVKADYTVTFGLPKRGHFLYPGAEYSGKLFIEDIGFPDELLRSEDISAGLLGKREMSLLLPERPRYSHKGDYGHVLIVAGSREKTGAAFMCARSCLTTGAGLVTIGIPETLVSAFQSRVTEEMILALPDKGDGTLSSDASEQILDFMYEKADILAIGPGLTVTDDVIALMYKIAGTATAPMVIDADAINALSKRNDMINLLLNAKAPVILTPHTGEMARLLKKSEVGSQKSEVELRKQIETNRINTAVSFAKETGTCLVLKGVPTIIATPEGNIFINTTGNPGMAKAGSGDVLTGMISAFLGQNLNPEDASKLGVFMHGFSGDIAMKKQGVYSILASDIIDAIPEAFLSLRQ